MSAPRLLYLCLETLDPDRAVHAHVHGILDPITARGWTTRLVAETGGRGRGITGQLMRYARLNLRALTRLPRCDAVYVRAHFAAWPAVMVARLLRKPVFHEVNGPADDIAITYPAMARMMGFIRWLYRSQYRAAAHVFAVTEGLAQDASAVAGHARVSVTPNGVDPARFSQLDAPRPQEAPGGPYVLFYGDVARWHGLDLMFEAARHPQWPENVSLVLIGRGSAAAQAGDVPPDLARRVVWFDRKPQAQLLPFIRHALAGLAPITDPGGRSSTGVMPLKVLEMLAGGLPVLVTDLPGQSDLVRSVQCGIVIAPQADELAGAVARLAAHPAEAAAMGARGAAAIRRDYAWPAISRRVEEEILRSLSRA